MKTRALVAALVCFSVSESAWADVAADVTPIQGPNAPFVGGWNELVVRISNTGAHPAKGEIAVTARLGRYGVPRSMEVLVPFAVGAGVTINVRVPVASPQYSDVGVVVTGEHGEQIVERRFSTTAPDENAFLLDVDDPSLARVALNEVPISPGFTPVGHARGTPPELLVGSPRLDPATGDPILPDRPALYGSTNAVLIRSDVLARITGAELDSLADYVLSGGTIAIAVTRPEDLLHPTLVAFAGGSITSGAVDPGTMRDLVLPAPPAGSGATKHVPDAANPTDDLAPTLTGYRGGNLKASLFGSSAAYGLGEAHLLAFDPTRKPAADDLWAQARMVEMARRAFDRRSTIVFPPGAEDADRDVTRIRQTLDPNENSRWGIAAAAMLLCAYAVVAGPVNFSLAAKKGKPLRALRWLPLFAAAAFLAIVGIGMISKGLNGRARHLTLIEASGGMTRGTARRYRGFFASQAKDITIRSSDWSGVLRPVATGSSDAEGGGHLVIDRDGTRLANVAALPWQTIVIREDATASLGEGIALARENGDVTIVNRSGHTLRAAVFVPPASGEAIFFARIKDGERVAASAGQPLSRTTVEKDWSAMIRVPGPHSGALSLHALSARSMPPCFEDEAPGIRDAFAALDMAAGDLVDWFPADVPVLLAQIDGGEGHTRDAGLRLESDRVLVRIVGWGGAP